jgi:hypothetical protein
VASLAADQFGAVARGQLVAMGCTDSWIAARLSSARWQKVHPGTYVLFTGPLPFRTRVSAALLRAGPGAMARGRTAAALDGLADEPGAGEPVDVLVPAARRVMPQSSIVVKRSRYADQRGHPAKGPARTRIEETVLDLCDSSGSVYDVAGWVSRACGRRLTTAARLRAALSARSRHRWRRELLAMLGDVELGAHSPLELEYLRAVERSHWLPPGIRQSRLTGRTVRWVDVDLDDFATRVELDGRLGHVDEGAFRDRERDNASTVSGRATLRYGWADVFGRPCEVAGEVADVLTARGWSGAPTRCGPACRLKDRGGLLRL